MGWASRRRRQFVVGSLRALNVAPVHHLRGWQSPCNFEEVVNAIFARACAYSPNEYFIADAEEIAELRNWASSRKETLKRHSGAIEQAQQFDCDPPDSWERTLITSERQRLEWYRGFRPGGIYDLGQTKQKQISTPAAGPLHCLIRGMGLVWVQSLEVPRVATAAELASAMGFPILPAWADAVQARCLWTRGNPAPQSRSRCNMLHQIGNSMHVNCIGAVLMTLTVLHAETFTPLARICIAPAAVETAGCSSRRRPPAALTTVGATRHIKRKLSKDPREDPA